MSFFVILCKNCGKPQAREIRTDIRKATFKCKFCNKSVKLLQENRKIPGLALKYYGPFSTGKEASNKVIELTTKMWENKNGSTKKN